MKPPSLPDAVQERPATIIAFVCDDNFFISRLHLDVPLASALEAELKTRAEGMPDQASIHSIAVYADVVDDLGNRAFQLLNDISQDTCGLEIDDDSGPLFDLRALLPQAQAMDDAALKDRLDEPLDQWDLRFIRDNDPGEHPIFYDQSLLVPQDMRADCGQWLLQLTQWMRDNEYADPIAYSLRSSSPAPHATIQSALDDLADQLSAAGHPDHPWSNVLRQEVGVAHAQTRSDRAPALLDPTASVADRRSRPRP